MNRTRLLELLAVVATAVGHYVFVDIDILHPVYLVVTIGGWMAYLAHSVRSRPDEVAEWGFRADGSAEAGRWIAMILAGAGGVMALIGLVTGHLTAHWHFLVCLAIYPLWGWVQQWLVQGVVVRSLRENGFGFGATVVLSAFAFGFAHWPDWGLILPTFALAFLFTPLWLRYRNLWPLGLAHGWLGAMLYYWVLGRDPIGEFVGLLIA